MMLLGTGLSGLVGSRITELLSETYTFEDISRKTGTDITNAQAVLERVQKSESPYILHLAAYTDVEAAEKEKNLGEDSQAWQINVKGTVNMIAAAQATGKRLIHISTDMVFGGDKAMPGQYKEEDERGPVNWYAATKYEAEKKVQQSNIPWTILRIAYPYRSAFPKNDSMRIFLSLLQKNQPIQAVTDHYFTPTFIDDLAEVVTRMVTENHTGIFHVTGRQSVSPYEIAMAVAESFSLDNSHISQVKREDFFKGRAQRPFNLSLNNAKITKLGIKMHTFKQGLDEIKRQVMA